MALLPAGSEEVGLTGCAIVGSSSISLESFYDYLVGTMLLDGTSARAR
jgi:hypothetical protein